MNGPPRIAHRSDVGLTPDQARDTRAKAWVYVFACFERHRNEKPVWPDNDTGDDPRGGFENDSRAKSIIPG